MTKAQLDDFESLLEETLSKTYSVADIVEGTVLKKENGGYLVSVKGAAFYVEKVDDWQRNLFSLIMQYV